MKKIQRYFGVLLLVCIILSASITVHAEGDANIDAGGGGMGNSSEGNYWPGHDGVRVTVVRVSDNAPVTIPVDLTNHNENSVGTYFGKMSKLSYLSGAALTPKMGVSYQYKNPTIAMPRIVSGTYTTANLDEIKAYFCSEYVVKMIADYVDFDYEQLTSGEYKLLLEPIAYMIFQGEYYAMTAHEAAVYNEMLGGTLRSKMISLSHKNLPLAMFLAEADLGIPAYTGAKDAPQSDSIIKTYLGAAVIKFRENAPPTPTPMPPPGNIEFTGDYDYRCDTDVITSFNLTTGTECNPDEPATARFTVNGTTYVKSNIYIPEGGSQLVWFKWHTPSAPGTLTMQISVSGATTAQGQLTASIGELTERTPPDPKATDKKPYYYEIPYPSGNVTSSSNSWSVWDCYWEADWVWEEDWSWDVEEEIWVDNGGWVDNGKWSFTQTPYTARLSVSVNLTPDTHAPTAVGKKMKSGYGVNISVSATASGNTTMTTGAQNAITYFPEFKYLSYDRVLEKTSGGNTVVFQFKKNIYSTYNSKVHFTPLWYPDGNYTVSTTVFDFWTPAGMLTCKNTDTVTIQGTVYDDWRIGPK